MILLDMCHCIGKGCDRREQCDRYVSWMARKGSENVYLLAEYLCVNIDRSIPVNPAIPAPECTKLQQD